MKVGICGCGFVGNAILQFFVKQDNIQTYVYDKFKKINSFNTLLDSEILFICLPTNYDENYKTYDMTEINITLSLLSEQNYKGIILIKSTVIPSYCSYSNDLYPNLSIIHNPEFLSAITAVDDFANQKHIIIGYTKQSKKHIYNIYNFYNFLFPLARLSICTSEEAGLTKLACNSFYATKIQYFTEIYLLCEKMNISYDNIKSLMLQNNWINPHHTNVPGHDNHISFGGACLPKDINALTQFMISNNSPCEVMKAVITERNKIRTSLI
jgi:nucleotide sugar dehydrogenase